jgi:hypothetical protein
VRHDCLLLQNSRNSSGDRVDSVCGSIRVGDSRTFDSIASYWVQTSVLH